MRIIACILSLLLACGPAFAAVTYDAASSSATTAASSHSYSHTTTSSANRLMLICVGYEEESPGVTITAPTYNSVSSTLVASAEHDDATTINHISMYKLVAPATGSNAVAVSLSGAVNAVGIGTITFSDVDQTAPLGTADTNSGFTGVFQSDINVTGVANGLVADCLNQASVQAIGNGAGQTERVDADMGGFFEIAITTSAATGTVTMTETWVTDNRFGHIAVPILPVATRRATQPIIFP